MTDPSLYPINPDEELEKDESPGSLFVNRKNRFLQLGSEAGLPDTPPKGMPPAVGMVPTQSFVTDIDAAGNEIVYAITSGDTYTCASTFMGTLDYFGGSSVALSLRRLVRAYSGPLIRVRRDSDDDELEIGFNSSGLLDTDSLAAFVPSGDGFVTRWYNQAVPGDYYGEGASGGNVYPPRIVSSGNIISDGLTRPYPAIEFPGSRWLEGTTLFSSNKRLSTYVVGSSDAVFVGGPVYDNGNAAYGGSYGMLFSPFGQIIAWQQDLNNSVSGAIVGGGVQTQIAYNGDGSNVQNLYRQGTLIDTETASPASRDANTLSFIGRDAGGSFLDGKIQEIIAYPLEYTANFYAITELQNNFYQIY